MVLINVLVGDVAMLLLEVVGCLAEVGRAAAAVVFGVAHNVREVRGIGAVVSSVLLVAVFLAALALTVVVAVLVAALAVVFSV